MAAIARNLIPQLLPKYWVMTDKWGYTVTDEGAIAIGCPDVSVPQGRSETTTLANPPIATVQPIHAPPGHAIN